jgi:hypothetical protein
MVTASDSILEEVERYLETLVRNLGRQVLLDTRIVEVTLKDELDLGLDLEISPEYGDVRRSAPSFEPSQAAWIRATRPLNRRSSPRSSPEASRSGSRTTTSGSS